MKWLVSALVLANVVLLFWFGSGEHDAPESVQDGRLPRVAEIELIADQGGGHREPFENVVEPVDISPEPAPQYTPEAVPDDIGESAEVTNEAVEIQEVLECFGVGWFEEPSDAAAYRDRTLTAQARNGYIRLDERIEALDDFHWVLVPPLATRDAAMARYRELVRQGVEAFVVQSGENENAISLGLFRSRRSAEELLQRRQAQNVEAVLANFPRNRISYALVFEGSPESVGFSESGSFADDLGRLQLIEISDCEGVATAEENP